MSSEGYNYERFDEHVAAGQEIEEFGAFANLLHAGASAPEISGTLLDDESPLQLSDVWRRRTTVVEFGSFT